MHGRLLLPAFFALCTPVAVVPLTRRYAAALLVVPWALVAAVSLRPVQLDQPFANGFFLPHDAGDVTIEDYGYPAGGRRPRWYDGPAVYIQDYEQRGAPFVRSEIEADPRLDLPVGVFGGVGKVSYAMGIDFAVLDIHSLADAFGSHLEADQWFGTFEPVAGHEKPIPAPWIAARITPPGAVVEAQDYPTVRNPLLEPTEGAAFAEQVAWARAALRCEEIREVLRAASAPMTAGRFADNLLGAFDRTRLRIPPDPETAYHRFCGPGIPDEVRNMRSGGVAAPTFDPEKISCCLTTSSE